MTRRSPGPQAAERKAAPQLRPGRAARLPDICGAHDKALAKAEERLLLLSSALDQTADSVVVTDTDGTILYVNPAFQKNTGYTAAESVGRTPSILKSGAHQPGFYAELWRTILSGQVFKAVFVNRRKDGELYSEERTISPVAVGGRIRYFVATGRDVTSRIRAEEALKNFSEELEARVQRRTAELQAANRELEAFAYSVSHDLRAPLRHIDAYAELLRASAGPQLPPKSRRLLDAVARGARRAGTLMDDLLAFSRMGRADLLRERVSLKALLRAALRDHRAERAGRAVEWRIGDLPDVRGDRQMLRLLLGNLVSNALKFTRGRDPAVIEVGAGLDGGRVVLCVRDNGVGFDMRFAAKLFGVFQRLHRAEEFEGSGIGLATVARIASRHGGRAWAEGRPGEGAAIFVALPAAGEAP